MGKTTVDYLWRDRKRTFLGLPWSFTIYKLTEDRLMVKTGFFNTKQENVMLYRIQDWTLSRTFGQMIFGLGTIICNTADKTSPILKIENIKNSAGVMKVLSDTVEKERERRRVSSREVMVGGDYDDDHDDHVF
jgi:uncharacterized membrane protein YdbT with pleckstrin-like domain